MQRQFMSAELRAVIATNAFGLGIDKPDIRLVAHWNFPGSIEAWYQEAGRAGRDGKPARATLLYRLEDKRIQSYFLGGKYPDRDESLSVWRALGSRSPALKARVEASGLGEKRVKVIREYFGEERGDEMRQLRQLPLGDRPPGERADSPRCRGAVALTRFPARRAMPTFGPGGARCEWGEAR